MELHADFVHNFDVFQDDALHQFVVEAVAGVLEQKQLVDLLLLLDKILSTDACDDRLVF